MSNWINVKRIHVLEAIRFFNEFQPRYPAAKSAFLIYEGRKYPAKHILRMAYEKANNEVISKYKSGTRALTFLNMLGFEVESSKPQMSKSSKADCPIIIVDSDIELNNPQYGLTPLIQNNTKYLILGTFPAKESIEANFYYQNQVDTFWGKALKAVGDFRNLDNNERIDLLSIKRIGLWDIFNCVEKDSSFGGRISNQDKSIKKAVCNDIALIINTFPNIKYIIFNGRFAHDCLLKGKPNVFEYSSVTFVELPSTSKLNQGSQKGKFNNGAEWTYFFNTVQALE